MTRKGISYKNVKFVALKLIYMIINTAIITASYIHMRLIDMSESNKKRVTHTMPALSEKQFELMDGFVRDEKRESQVLHVVEGTAWVTMDGRDIILNEGEELRLSHGKYDVVVSATGQKPLIYEIKE
jgi:mannose-6-phosphate isomerase class I